MADGLEKAAEHPSFRKESELDKYYHVGPMLGKGGSGTVHAGTRLRDGLPVAIKYVPTKRIYNWEIISKQRFPMEVSILQKLRGTPGIVQYYDSLHREEYLIIIMERPRQSMDLLKFIQQKKYIKEDMARSFFIQIVKAVICCYEAGIMHNDLETSNILVNLDTFETLLIDFGFSTSIPRRYLLRNTDAGSQQSPEKEAKTFYYQERFTVWKLGVILHCMLTGETGVTRYANISKESIMALPNISADCKTLLHDCMFAVVKNSPTLHDLLRSPWLSHATDEGTASQSQK